MIRGGELSNCVIRAGERGMASAENEVGASTISSSQGCKYDFFILGLVSTSRKTLKPEAGYSGNDAPGNAQPFERA